MGRAPLTTPHDLALFRMYFGCLAQTINYLHEMNILHKDIKPENILLKDGRLILTDFGTAYDWSESGQSMTRSNINDVRTPKYMSPEVANLSGFHRSSDIWSLGVVFLEMVSVLRGRGLDDMDRSLKSNGTKTSQIHSNLGAALSWLETLQHSEQGLPTDNEPISWLKEMLNHDTLKRPSANQLAETILAFDNGSFCGQCCKDESSDESTRAGFDDEQETLHSVSREVPKTSFVLEDISGDLPSLPGQYPQVDTYSDCDTGARIDWGLPTPAKTNKPSVMKDIVLKEKSRKLHEATNKRTEEALKDKTSTGNISTAPPTLQPATHPVRPGLSTSKRPGFSGRESFKQWLAVLPPKFKSPNPHTVQPQKRQVPPSGQQLLSAEGTQRIAHYLFTLPEGPSDFEAATLSGRPDHLHWSNMESVKRSATWSAPVTNKLERSKSQEDLTSSSHLLQGDNYEERFVEVNATKHVRCPSDSNLPLLTNISNDGLKEIVQELQTFAAKTRKQGGKKQKSGPRLQSIPSKNRQTSLAKENGQELPSTVPENEDINLSSTKQTRNSAGPGIGRPERRLKQIKPSEVLPADDKVRKATGNATQALRDFLPPTPRPKRRRFETASMARERILQNKTSQAGTSMMSANTRAKVSGSRWLLRWNDSFYGYLPAFVAQGKSAAVRELLAAGCNPGTIDKPRLALIHNAVQGATYKHLKCLQALVSYGADVNAMRKGRSPLHYAIEQESWSGYSAVIITLLAARANPNAKDPVNDVPLLMLLIGKGELPEPKREALLFLLAPQFKTNIRVTVPSTLDNPLHLAIRRKDPYAVDAVLEKMSNTYTIEHDIIHRYNASGFTPILLALTTFTFGTDSEIELNIIKLLLEHGACPDDQDKSKGDTPLHLVVRTSKSAIALELLCRRSANPRIRNNLGKRVLDLVKASRGDEAEDLFRNFALLRMRQSENAINARPPDLTAWIAEEDEENGDGKILAATQDQREDVPKQSKASSRSGGRVYTDRSRMTRMAMFVAGG